MMEVIDNIQTSRGRYNDLALATEDNTNNNSSAFEIESSRPSGSFENDDGSTLEQDLERELTRRSRKRLAKFCLVGMVCVMSLLAIFYNKGHHHKTSTMEGANTREQPQPEIGGGTMNFDNHQNDDDPFPAADIEEEDETIIETVEEGIQDIKSLVQHYSEALPSYKICPPPLVHDRPDTQKDNNLVYHIGEFRIVPEDTSENNNVDDDVNKAWHYTLSDMDVSNDASIIALGLGDYAADTDLNEVGMVRVYAYSCDSNEWQRLGQDLIGANEYEMFGHRVSSNRDGTVLAISAPQGSYSEGNGFVEVYTIDVNDDSGSSNGRWEMLGSRIDSLPDAESEYYMLGHAVDISDKGETLAILGIIDDEFDNPSYVTRVFDYDYRTKEWKRKGHDLVISNVTFGQDYTYDYSPQVRFIWYVASYYMIQSPCLMFANTSYRC